ncbi:MAG: hypothetical protein MUQ20_01160, partial [Deltaproteobacteria bacterium]|nr:hypothetical protein [Deltaproteobacteria bacterium]
WETHLVQEMSGRPKAALNLQIAKDCDILIGAFWTRIGTDTGFAESHIIEEIKEFQKAGKPVMIYYSSVPVVPSSVDLKQYEKLMRFIDDCLNQGLVERYDSILDFREKLSRQIASKMLKIQTIPKDETSRDPNETVKKESNDMIFQKFCDLIKGYLLNWTREKNSKPTSFDGGKQILKDLKMEILSLRVPLVKIFSNEIIKNIAEIITKLENLQKYRLYLDPKSIRDFWKLGDEIFSSLDSIAGKVRKEINGHTYSKD